MERQYLSQREQPVALKSKVSSRPSVPRALVLGLQKIIPNDCFLVRERIRSQHRQWFFGFWWRKFPIELGEIFVGQFDLD